MQCDNDLELGASSIVLWKLNSLVFNIVINTTPSIEEQLSTASPLLLTFVVDLMIHIRAYPPESVVLRLGVALPSAIEPRRSNVRR
jgi:hypothetical protein